MRELKNFIDELNDAQKAPVLHKDGPLMVIAGAGSGKTRVLTYRIAHLINTGVPPWEILTLTFTNKAAKEMKERISKVVGSRGNSVWAGTFHSVFARILRVEADKIGFPNSFTIYDTDDSKSLLKNMHSKAIFGNQAVVVPDRKSLTLQTMWCSSSLTHNGGYTAGKSPITNWIAR